jgi:hypothetical protein
MRKPGSKWYVPADWLWHLSMSLTILCMAVMTGLLLPLVTRLKTNDLGALYGIAVGAGVVGIVLLFISRLPLYRQRRVWTIGPRELDRKHRRFYWLAYTSVAVSVFLLVVVWLRTK